MYDDLSGEFFRSLRHLFEVCAPLVRRPAPRVRRIRDDRNRPLIMITQRDDLLLLEPREAIRLARRLLQVARDGRVAHTRIAPR